MIADIGVQTAASRPGGIRFDQGQAEADSSARHVVIIPSFNSGPKLLETVVAARRQWAPVWVVIDGSTDGSDLAVAALAARDSGIRVFPLARNQGKGAAILHALRHAELAGYTHALTMDADGQHPSHLIPRFILESCMDPRALILGFPVFDRSAPRIRVLGHKLANLMTNIETLWVGEFDSLFGFRVYPVRDLREIMDGSRWMRRFDFDAEAAVRLCWRGFTPKNIAAPVRYFSPAEGGISHFRYLRDNILLSWMHLRLLSSFLRSLPHRIGQRLRSSRH